MRKVLMLFFVAFAAFTLFGCNSSEYKVDGTSAVTIKTDGYFTVLKSLFDFAGTSVE